jgi:radical SAM protein with 4Fe4S-binding SPASM domain
MGCNKWNESGEPLSVERWRNLIDQLKDLGCRKLFIGGGDLTLNWKRTLDILDHTKGKFQTYVKLHQSSISQKVLNDLENRAEPLIQLERTDEVPEIDGFFVLPIEPEKLKETKLPEGKKIMLDFVSEAFDALPEDLPLTSKKKIAKTSIYQFFHNVKFHPCLGNSITITFSGNVLPCPMMRSHVFGNVKEKELYEVFWKEKEGMEKFWKMTLDAVENCSECEFRYACNDCRALEEKLTGKWDGKRLCNYDPQEGKWL